MSYFCGISCISIKHTKNRRKSLSETLATLIQDKGVTKSTEVGGIAKKASQDIEQYPQERVYRIDMIRDGVVVDIDQS